MESPKINLDGVAMDPKKNVHCFLLIMHHPCTTTAFYDSRGGVGIHFAFGSSLYMAMDCIGLAKEWEKDEHLRTRLREEKKIMIYPATDRFCKPNRVNSVTNEIVILPVLKRLQATSKKKLPHLVDLTMEVQTLCEKTGLSTADRFAYKTSVEIKKMAGFIKRRAQKKEVTKEKG